VNTWETSLVVDVVVRKPPPVARGWFEPLHASYPSRRSLSWTVPVTARLWVAVAEPLVPRPLVIRTRTVYRSARGKAYSSVSPRPMDVPRLEPPFVK
jgi:hypothetical protein